MCKQKIQPEKDKKVILLLNVTREGTFWHFKY